jgi:hypothetical protein
MSGGAEGQGPIYPHTEWINGLIAEQETRRLTEAEVTAITEAQMFENLIRNAIPELREIIEGVPPGIEHDNAQMYLVVATKFARGMGLDLAGMMEAKNLVKTVLMGIKL